MEVGIRGILGGSSTKIEQVIGVLRGGLDREEKNASDSAALHLLLGYIVARGPWVCN
jgi:hypothetical protein